MLKLLFYDCQFNDVPSNEPKDHPDGVYLICDKTYNNVIAIVMNPYLRKELRANRNAQYAKIPDGTELHSLIFSIRRLMIPDIEEKGNNCDVPPQSINHTSTLYFLKYSDVLSSIDYIKSEHGTNLVTIRHTVYKPPYTNAVTNQLYPPIDYHKDTLRPVETKQQIYTETDRIDMLRLLITSKMEERDNIKMIIDTQKEELEHTNQALHHHRTHAGSEQGAKPYIDSIEIMKSAIADGEATYNSIDADIKQLEEELKPH